MKYKIIQLGKDYPGKITDFAQARNSFLTRHEWILFIDDDEEASDMLLAYLDRLEPSYPHYWIRRINLFEGRYLPGANPDYAPRLVSNKVRFVGRVHERIVPRKPHGIIDFPIIHNHVGPRTFKGHWYEYHPLYRLWGATKKAIEVLRGR